MRPAIVLVSGLLWFAGGPALAGEPSAACRDGAASCQDAWGKLDACQQASAGKPGSCEAEKNAADAACKSDASACDRDGSRAPPAHARNG